MQVIDFLASRNAKSPSLLAVELMNEPLAPGISLKNLKTYYCNGYNAVRKHSSKAYVIMPNRLFSPDPTELLGLAGGLPGSVIDVHYYALFNNIFDTFTVQQNIDFIKTNYSSDLSTVTRQDGPLTFVGE
uniref:Glycoside hydrolase family 5 domain-containing protein n=2 Tax=Aegilops tauschii TaxID=37682 RepID=A0A453AKJ6_AEGTS